MAPVGQPLEGFRQQRPGFQGQRCKVLDQRDSCFDQFLSQLLRHRSASEPGLRVTE